MVPHPLVFTQGAAALKTGAGIDQAKPRKLAPVLRSTTVPPVAPPVAQPTVALTSVALAGQVIDDKTNLRSGPSTAFDKVVKLNHNDVVKLLSRHGNWFSVATADGTQGWIEQSLLTLAPGAAELIADAISIPTTAPQPMATKAPIPANVADTPTTVATTAPTARPKPAPTPEPAPQIVRAARVATWVWPTSGDITSPFGYRDFEVGGSSFHNGIDISNSRWTPIVAARSGTVIEAGWCSGYGYCVIMDNGGGYTTEYGHMASSPVVYAGQELRAGQSIGYMGSTYDAAGGGYSTGVHLHFTIKINGRAVDPLRFLP